MMVNNHLRRTTSYRRTALALALGMGFSGLAFGQSTTGSIFGQVPNSSGTTVLIQNTASGLTRTVPVDSTGHYSISSLPVGTYKVTLQQNGQTVDSRSNVTLNVGAGIDVSFTSSAAASAGTNAKNLSTVTVSANSVPAIDVSSVSTSTVITQQQLQTLPIAHSAESIALLSPGVVKGSGYFGNVVSFGGASVTENAYYVNGFNTTAMYDYTGSSYQLPYGAISQQQTYTGGYSAKYGRSDGGVINQVGSRGSNDWHFGAKVMWAPRFAESAPKNQYFPYQNIPAGYTIDNAGEQGELQRYRNKNTSWTTEYSAYAGGPLIKDRLFFFIAAQQTRSDNRSVSSEPSAVDTRYKDKENNIYTKLDWNITDSHILELTQISDSQRNGEGTQDHFDGDTRADSGFIGKNDINKYSTSATIAQYTGYLTDDLTLGVLYGTMTQKNPVLYPYFSSNPYISGSSKINPAYPYNGTSDQTQLYAFSPSAKTHTQALRADLSYHLGDHTIELGIDNQKYTGNMQGQTMSGPGYAWIYGTTGNPSLPISTALGVGAPGQTYFVRRYIYSVATNMSADQKAWYLQDAWQINDRFLLSVGLRNDHFINYNNVGKAFVDEKNQWEPRIGFSWDVNGDSSFKLYGNAGRYYLALPQSVAARAATPSTYTSEYYTYTGVNPATGVPTGLTCVNNLAGTGCAGPVSSNNELGQPIDPKVVTATNLKAQYQDEFILGFDKTLGANWVYGANGTYRHLKTAIDDICDVGRIATKIDAMGMNSDDYDWEDPGCRIFNPGLTNNFVVNSTTGGAPINVTMTKSDWGLTQGAVRKYYALNAYIEHPFDGKWTARVDYTFSRSWGNQEGQVRSDIGQTDVSKTEDWDYASLMDGAYGYLANNRRHQFKFRGAYQFTPEWLVSGTMLVQSGTPKNCLGYYGPSDTSDPSGYAQGGAGDYHWCFGHRSPPGSTGSTPWTKQLNLTLRYTPEFADKRLAFTFDVFNVFNEQKAIQIDPHSVGGIKSVSNTYNTGLYFEQPRYMRLSVSYDY